MRYVLRVALILLLPACAYAQDVSLAVPDRTKVDGVPPIPMSIVDAVAPYGQFRQARFLSWHPTRRRILVSTAFGNVSQIHEVKSPGGARTQLTFFRDGVTGGASYEPGGRYFVFRKDTSGGGEAMQLFRYDLDSGRITLLTDAKSRHGVPVWSHRRGLIAYSSTRRNGKDRDLWVMNPLEEGSERALGEFDGSWDVLDWSADDRELLAVEFIAGSSETRLWRIAVDSGRRRLVTPQDWPTRALDSGAVQRRWTIGVGAERPRFRSHESLEAQSCVRSVDAGEHEEGVGVEAFSVSPVGSLIAVVADRGATSELQLVDANTRTRRRVQGIPPGIIWNVSWHGSGTALAIEFAGARTFRDVYALDVKSGRVGAMDGQRNGRREPGLAAGCRDHSLEEF